MSDLIKMEDLGDEQLDASQIEVLPTHKICRIRSIHCAVSDEALDAPALHAVPTLCICHIPPPPCSFCTVSD